MSEYIGAELAGRKEGDCFKFERDCSRFNITDITILSSILVMIMILVIVTIIILNELIKKFSKFKPLAIFRSLFKLNKYSREAQVIRWHSHRFHLEDHS